MSSHVPLRKPACPAKTTDVLFHAAFLSYLRLSIYMAVVSVAITVSFHLKSDASPLELRMAKPLGSIFWALSVATLFVGLGNYIGESLSHLPISLAWM